MEEAQAYKIAVLITCYNRKQKTLAFLESLAKQEAFKKSDTDIFLLDDGSSDGTGIAVKEKYPFVKIVEGTGNLFWAGGMRAIWKHAMSVDNYGLFLLFNDDVVLFDNAFGNLIMRYKELNKKGVILIGSTMSAETKKITYGGMLFHNLKRWDCYRAIPDDKEFTPCPCGNANVLLVDRATVESIGVFSDAYTHSYADFDYTLTAYKKGIDVLIAPGYYAYCEDDHGVNWLSGKYNSLKKRIEYLYSPKGLAYKEHLYFMKKHFPADYAMSFAKLWLKTLFPILWDKFKLKENH